MGITYEYLRRYADAEHYFDVSISLAPDEQYAYANKAENYRVWLEQLRADTYIDRRGFFADAGMRLGGRSETETQ